MKLQFPNLTLFASMFSRDQDVFDRTLRVLRHCHRVMEPARTVFFSHLSCEEFEWIPSEVNDWLQWNLYINHILPKHLDTDFSLQVHHDGFPINPAAWDSAFFNYDFIGSPWPDKSVGNNGFCLESKRFYQAKMTLPESTEYSDVYLCRTHRKTLESMGLKFAPFEVASRFGCEFIDFKSIPHFGFHGQGPMSEYSEAWKILEQGESTQCSTLT